jgi:hypothetical protein
MRLSFSVWAMAWVAVVTATTISAEAQDVMSPDELVAQLVQGGIDPVTANYAPLALSGETGNEARRVLGDWIRATSCGAGPGELCGSRPITAPSCAWRAINLGWGAAHDAPDPNAYSAALSSARSWLSRNEAELEVELGQVAPSADGWPAQVMRMRVRDQFWRRLRAALGRDETLPRGAERSIRYYMASVRMCEADQQSAQFVGEIFEREGWPRISQYGEDVDQSFWLLVQHAPLSLQEAVLPELERLYPLGETAPRNFGMLYDRVMQRNGQPQRYGSHYTCPDGVHQLYQVEDEAALNEYRAALGMPPIEEEIVRRC